MTDDPSRASRSAAADAAFTATFHYLLSEAAHSATEAITHTFSNVPPTIRVFGAMETSTLLASSITTGAISYLALGLNNKDPILEKEIDHIAALVIYHRTRYGSRTSWQACFDYANSQYTIETGLVSTVCERLIANLDRRT